jgi:hypothetical protein
MKSKLRLEMGEDAWEEYQKQRKIDKAKLWKARNVQKVVDWRRRAKQRLIDYKGGKCEICGYNKQCSSCYDFHHKDPKTKEFSISGKGITRNFDLMKKEVDKCQLLCKNCHAEVHELEYTKQREDTILRHKKWLKKLGKDL